MRCDELLADQVHVVREPNRTLVRRTARVVAGSVVAYERDYCGGDRTGQRREARTAKSNTSGRL
jgi:hypothetical protein